jgi:hypothetical protein
MDDDIIVFGPIEFAVQGQDRSRGAIVCPIHVDLDIGSGLDVFLEGFFLFVIIVAKTAGDEEISNRIGF